MQQRIHCHVQRQICQWDIGRNRGSFNLSLPTLATSSGPSPTTAPAAEPRLALSTAGDLKSDSEQEEKRRNTIPFSSKVPLWICHRKWSFVKNCNRENHTELLWCSSIVRKPKSVSLALNHTNGRSKSWTYGTAVDDDTKPPVPHKLPVG